MNLTKIADYWEKLSNNSVKCGLCPHSCTINDGKIGLCGARINQNGTLYAANYGLVTSIALDPIEKKPLYKFHPGKNIVSIGSFGCNLRCSFCQNYRISKEYENIKPEQYTPELLTEVAVLAKTDKNIGIAYTYNEPLIGYEFIKDVSTLTRKEGLLNILVTNGYINQDPRDKLLQFIDAVNVDIKGNNNRTYNMVGGTIEPVKEFIAVANQTCHVEVTTLVIPNENEDDVEDIAKWLSQINPEIPYHLSRFFPRYKYNDKEPTPYETMYRLYDVAKKYLKNVYIGNL